VIDTDLEAGNDASHGLAPAVARTNGPDPVAGQGQRTTNLAAGGPVLMADVHVLGTSDRALEINDHARMTSTRKTKDLVHVTNDHIPRTSDCTHRKNDRVPVIDHHQ